MFDIGGPELLVILLGIIVLFGPKKIPEVAQMIGKGIQKVRSAQSQFKEQMDEIQSELSVVNKVDFTNISDSIKEINPKDLNQEHFSTNNNSNKSGLINSEIENQSPNSEEHGFTPVQPENLEDPYHLDTTKDLNEEESQAHLNGTSHGLPG